MKTTLQKLTDKLCECEAVREDIMELRFGCKIRYRNTDYSLGVNNRWFLSYTETATITWDKKYFDSKKGVEYIGNHPSLRHLMMYCEEKNKPVIIATNGSIKYLHMVFDSGPMYKIIVNLDNTLPFNEQPEETLELILDFLNR